MSYIVELEDIKLQDQYNEPIFKDGWSESSQNRFEKYLLDCKVKMKKHTKSAQYYDSRNTRLSVPTVVLSALVAGLSTLNIDQDTNQIISYSTAILAILSTVMDMLFANLALGKRSEKHRQSVNSYSELVQKIEQQLFLPFEQRDTVEHNFNMFHKEFTLIHKTEPIVPSHIDDAINLEVAHLCQK